MSDLPPELGKAATGLIGPAIGALTGVLMRHSQLAQRGDRPFWSIHLLYEVPTVIGMGIIGGGLASYLQLSELTGWGLAAFLGYYGPRAIDLIVQLGATKLGAKAKGD